jgi:hypothetical protein
MNLLQRRKILKKANFLDLHPVKVIGEEPAEKPNRVNLLMPRFSNRYTSAMFQPRHKDMFIRIRLDDFGSFVWNSIDGINTAGEIARKLDTSGPEGFLPGEETHERVTSFLSMLYQQRYITFREITG